MGAHGKNQMKTYELQKTKNDGLFRVVDREGNWRYYFHEGKKQYFRAVNYIIETGYPKGYFFYEWLKSKTKDEAEKILKTAGNRGSRVHDAITRIFDTKDKFTRFDKVFNDIEKRDIELTNDEWDALLSWQEFMKRHEAKTITYEYSIWNAKHRYAGTLYWIGILTKDCGVRTCKCTEYIGKIGLVDWKTSGGIYGSYNAQTGSYVMAQNLKDVLGKTKIDYSGVVRIGTNHKLTGGYEFKPFSKEETKRNFDLFIHALGICEFETTPFNPDTEIIEIPDVVDYIPEFIDVNPVPDKKKLEDHKQQVVKKMSVKPIKKYVNNKTTK